MRSALCLVLAGCLGSPPREPTVIPPPPKPSQRVLLGTTVDVTTSWTDTCKDSHLVITSGNAPEAHGVGTIDRETTYTPCRPQPFNVTASCTLRCAPIDTDGQYTGGATVSVRALELGVMTVSVEMIHSTTHEHRGRDRTVEVARPDAFVTQCMTPTKDWGSCAQGLLADNPMIRIWAKFDGKLLGSPLLTVNAAAAPANAKYSDGVSLADVLGKPITPGTYALAISLGDKTETVSIDAH